MPELEAVSRLTKDLKEASKVLGRDEARFLTDYYYQVQKVRMATDNQVASLQKNEPHAVLDWLGGNAEVLERNIQAMLLKYAESHEVGKWSLSIYGIGPVIAAGLIAHIDIEKAPTVGHIWRFAGLDPTSQWMDKAKVEAKLKSLFTPVPKRFTYEDTAKVAGAFSRSASWIFDQLELEDDNYSTVGYATLVSALSKRPWNAALKTLCWKIGESFTKVSGREEDVYGKVWLVRKHEEWEKNKQGLFADQADAVLSRVSAKDADVIYWMKGCMTPEAVEQYEKTEPKTIGLAKKLAGEPGVGVKMLCPGHIHARSKRYAVKLFLAHWHHVAYEVRFNQKPPKPYVIDHLGHAHFIAPPNWPMVE